MFNIRIALFYYFKDINIIIIIIILKTFITESAY